MATKYVRLNPRSNNTTVQNLYGANRFIRKNYQMSNFKIAIGDYSDGDKIEIRVVGAKKVLFMEVQNATTGAKITIEAVDAYTKTLGEKQKFARELIDETSKTLAEGANGGAKKGQSSQ